VYALPFRHPVRKMLPADGSEFVELSREEESMSKLAGLASAAALLFTVACGQTDAGITTAVKSKLATDDMVKAYQVDVDTRDKVVTLTGEVETMAQKERAVTIARNTDGVTDVIDQLRVNPTAATTGIGDPGIDLGEAARRGVDAAKEGARDAGRAVRDAVTDDDRDTDKDGK
jgi:hypothetical protein